MSRPILTILFSLALLIACRPDGPEPSGNLRADALKIEVAESGFYRLSPAILAQANLSLQSFSAESTHLQQGDTAVPFLIDGDDLIFYGQAPTNRYTAVRTYLLTQGKAGTLMGQTAVPTITSPSLSQLPISLHLEENNFYQAVALTTLPPADQDTSLVDLWFWQTLDLRQQSITIPLQLPTAADGSATLSLQLWGQSENHQIAEDHDIDLVINDKLIETIRWDGRRFHQADIALPPGTLKPGQNSLLLDNSTPGASFLDVMLLNWLKISYMAQPTAVQDRLQFSQAQGHATLSGFSQRPLLFNTNDPANPTLLTGWSYSQEQVQLGVEETMEVTAVAPQGYLTPANIQPLRASDWQNPHQQADLIILTTDELMPALAPLVEARQAQGLTVALVPAAEIYDTFGHGQAIPESITAFVQHTLTQWQAPQPRYLLLVGTATTDYRHYLGAPPANIIPAPMVPVLYSGETVSDSRLVDIDGDKKPDMAVGRWPLNQVQDVQNLVAQTLAYETATAVDHTFFVTDASEAQFATIAQRLSDGNNLAATLLNGPQTAEIVAQFNQGAWLATYIGHGSVGQWGKDNLFTFEAISQLNSHTAPIVLQLTCLTGLFAYPYNPSLSEQMLLQAGGPVLTIAATSLTLSSHQEAFANSLLRRLQSAEMERIGDAFQAAKLELNIDHDGLREISDTFVLLGDPSAKIVRP